MRSRTHNARRCVDRPVWPTIQYARGRNVGRAATNRQPPDDALRIVMAGPTKRIARLAQIACATVGGSRAAALIWIMPFPDRH